MAERRRVRSGLALSAESFINSFFHIEPVPSSIPGPGLQPLSGGQGPRVQHLYGAVTDVEPGLATDIEPGLAMDIEPGLRTEAEKGASTEVADNVSSVEEGSTKGAPLRAPTPATPEWLLSAAWRLASQVSTKLPAGSRTRGTTSSVQAAQQQFMSLAQHWHDPQQRLEQLQQSPQSHHPLHLARTSRLHLLASSHLMTPPESPAISPENSLGHTEPGLLRCARRW